MIVAENSENFSTHEHVSCLKYLQCRMLSHYFWLICTIRSQECEILSSNEAMIAAIISIFLFFNIPLIYFDKYSFHWLLLIKNNLSSKADFWPNWTKKAKCKNESNISHFSSPIKFNVDRFLSLVKLGKKTGSNGKAAERRQWLPRLSPLTTL